MSNLLYYGISNGVGVAFCLVFCIVCISKFKNADYNKKLLPLKFLYILLICLEVVKIFYHICYAKNYPAQRYPIVFCSLVMYTYPIICYTKSNSIACRVCKALSVIPCIVIGSLYLFVGFGNATGASDYSFIMNLHSRFYHFCMLAGAIYIIAVKLYDFNFKDFYFSGLAVSAYFVLCTVLSLFVGDNISYFGPTSAPVQIVYNNFGYAVGNLLLCILAWLISFIVFMLINLIKHLAKRKKSQLQNK